VDEGLSLMWLPKAAVYGLGQLVIGIAIVRRLGNRTGTFAEHDANLEHYFLGFARALALLLVIALTFRLWAQTASAFGYSDGWAFENLRVIALESRWGHGWRLQMIAVAVLMIAVFGMHARPIRWPLFATGAVGLALAMPMLGHAAGSSWRHAIHVSHNLAAAAWVGTLGVITIAAWHSRARPAIEPLVRAFSPVALTSAGIVLASGVVASWIYVGSWSSLWGTAYGGVLIAKLTGVTVVLACGGINWREVRRGGVPSRLVMSVEWLAVLAVIGLTGVLTETEHP
jgi:putative copper export protein